MSLFDRPACLELHRAADELGRWLESEPQPRKQVAELAAAGLARYTVPAAFGGVRERVSLVDLCVIRRALGYWSGLLDTMFVMQGLGSYPITVAGTEAQKRAILPEVAAGRLIPAFALTEPEAGSDVSAVATRAEPTDGGYRLSGEKLFISNAPIADLLVVFARTGSERSRGLSAFLVDPRSGGTTVEPLALLADHPAGRVHLDGARGDLLGALGDGFSIALATLDLFRTSVGAAAAGMARRALDEALGRSRQRRQFGKALVEFQATQLALAEMAVEVTASELLVAEAAERFDAGERVTRAAAMAKLYATEAAQRVIDRALQLHGGQGLIRGAVVERLYREVRAMRIYEGTSEIQKLVIARELTRPPTAKE